MNNHAEMSPLSRAFYYVISVLVGLPLIYLLSVGPAVVIVVKAPKLRNQVRAIYAPMIWVHDHTSLKKPMDRYLGFWEQTAHQI